jgi:hypothetical protein
VPLQEPASRFKSVFDFMMMIVSFFLDVAIFASAFAYISDVSTVENRTLRITILDVCYLSTMPTGVAIGN